MNIFNAPPMVSSADQANKNDNLLVGSAANQSIDNSINYFQESCKLYLANVLLTNQLKEMLQEKIDLVQKLCRLEKSNGDPLIGGKSYIGAGQLSLKPGQSQLQQQLDDKKRRHRRSASQIERNYCCPITECAKSYGSEGSLQQHMKIKHPDFNLKDYQFKPTIIHHGDSVRHSGDDQDNDDDHQRKSDMDSDEIDEEANEDNENTNAEQSKPSEVISSALAAATVIATNTSATSAAPPAAKKRGRPPLSQHNNNN